MASDPEALELFISFAHADNVPLFGAERGWVSTLVHDLRNLLAQKMGHQEAFSLWFDAIDLRGNFAITPDIPATLQQAAAMLLVLSPSYKDMTSLIEQLKGHFIR